MPSSDPVSSPRRHLPLFMRESWPLAACLTLLLYLLYAFDANPFRGLDSRWGDMLIRLRFQLAMEPRPDPRVFIVGLNTSDLVGASTTEAEYHTYADLFDILTGLNVSATGIDLIMARGSEKDARPVIDSIHKNGHIVLAEAQTSTMIERSFLFAPPSFPSGLINIAADSGGVHRRYSYGVALGDCKPSLALATYLASFRPPKEAACAEGEAFVWKELSADGLTLLERKVPSQSVLLNFRSPYTQPWDRGFKYLKAADLRSKYESWLKAGSDPNQISALGLPDRESIVLLGSVATGGGDSGPTPFGVSEPLLELHATALNDLIQRLPLKEAPPLGNLGFTVLGLLLITLAGRWSPDLPRLLLSCAAVILIMVIAGAALLFKANIMVAGVTPALFMAAGVFGESGRRATLASFEKAQLRETLGRYFSPNVLKDVLKNPDSMQPREADLTVLLTDVRNFTTITERYGTKRMFDLLNEIFEVETKAVIESDGSMEHFVGDQFLAYWGAPQEQPDAADRALQSAERIINGLDKLHATLEPAVKELFG
ncbi:MAG TPA: adenylate/guanylate cyclase domain-containing protein, partial [Bryobacteraceae bacterium]|nr:adenylate/guanylate cyclase domain-containing protein [Bryobacteraceae bacterium]